MPNILINARDPFDLHLPDTPIIRISIFDDHGHEVVADHVGGFPPEIFDKIFEPHFFTEGPHGTDSSLHIFKTIIERNKYRPLSIHISGGDVQFRIKL